YARILPTIGDPPDVAAAKIDALTTTLQQKRDTVLENLSAAGYGVDGFNKPSAPPRPIPSHSGGGGATIRYERGSDGKLRRVP
ncbi:hypothetical protein, partial [Streptococcus pneumoniae]|uniref:hypothetical protein n=1 Tax=Streptococcus pneumoniae TaxID=1313 RepID=UPI0018B0E932